MLALAMMMALLQLPAQAGQRTAACSTLGPAFADDAALETRGARVGEIRVRVVNVFDTTLPEEDKKLFRLVNRLHLRTRPWVVRNYLLFASGDPYSRRLLEESERLLRAERFFFDATVRPVRQCGDTVDVEVVVRDVWTLFLSVGFGRAGGTNSVRFEVQDVNFLGLGKDLAVERKSDVDRTTSFVRYRDHSLAGTHARLELWYVDLSDGDLQVVDLRRPFFALDTRWAAGLRVRLDDRVDHLYFRGEETGRFRHRQDFVELSGGLSAGLVQGRALRWNLGLTYVDDRFSAVGGPAPAELPEDRTLAYPWLGFEWVEDEYRERTNLDRLQRTEDLYLGRQITGRLGFSSTLWGGDRDRAVFSLGARDALDFGEERLLLVAGHASGRWGRGGAENLLVGAAARLYWRNLGRHLFFAEASADFASNLDPENQLLLGGDNGLRGYPLRYQEGDRRFLLTLEQRFYTPWHILRLVHVGAAVFIDVGRAWFPGEPPSPGGGLLRDVGFGLRLANSRSGRGTLVHLDVAFPLDGDPSIDKVQWLVTTKESF